MKFVQLEEKLKREFFPVILIEGDDAFLRQRAIETICASVGVAMPELNLTVLREPTASETITCASSFPFLSEKRIVVVRDFAAVKSGKASAVKEVAPIAEYARNPLESTCLILSDDNQSGCFDSVKGERVDCSKPDLSFCIGWINEFAASGQAVVAKGAAALLAEYCLRDMSRISAETAKLVSFGEITNELVEQNVTQDVEYAVFDLSDALSEKNAVKAIEIMQTLLNGGEDVIKIIITLYNSYRRMFYSATGECGAEELGRLFNVKPYAMKRAAQTASRYSATQLKSALELCSRAEKDMRDFSINDKEIVRALVLDLLCV